MAGLGVVVAAAVLVAVLAWLGRRRPQRPEAPMLPAAWREALPQLVPPHARLTPALRQRHLEQVETFILQKRFVDCGGLYVTDAMRLTIAGYACLLVLRPGALVFPQLQSVLVYPGAFLVPVNEPDEFGLVSDEPEARIGESWEGERVILSWEDVQAAAEGADHNVVVHEFAHQLDDETPQIAGAPRLPDYGRWSKVMQREFERLQRHRRPPVLDVYGAQSPQEFFCVASEAFVQRPEALRRHHPELFEVLRAYYGFDLGAIA